MNVRKRRAIVRLRNPAAWLPTTSSTALPKERVHTTTQVALSPLRTFPLGFHRAGS